MKTEKLAMLTARGLDLDHIPGGVAELTQMDIAGAMHKLNDLEYELLSAKYFGGKHHEVYAYFFEWAMAQGWGLPKGKTDQSVDFAVRQAIGPNRCQSCNGVAELMIDSKKVKCAACNGSGIYYADPPKGCADAIKKLSKELQRVEYSAIAKINY